MSGQYHNALYAGEVEERIKLLKSLGQGNEYALIPRLSEINVILGPLQIYRRVLIFGLVFFNNESGHYSLEYLLGRKLNLFS